jgi:GNAT superfamily N-acetyltransferase
MSEETYIVTRDGFTLSTARARLDLDAVYRYLSEESYWAAGMARDVFERSVAFSLPFGLYEPGGAQIGYARVVTDQAVFAWLSDVYVLKAYRGKRLGHFLVEGVMAHPRLQGLRRWMLSTRDAHRIYAEYGFGAVDPESLMTRLDREAES